jgi:hypothetical protein
MAILSYLLHYTPIHLYTVHRTHSFWTRALQLDAKHGMTQLISYCSRGAVLLGAHLFDMSSPRSSTVPQPGICY